MIAFINRQFEYCPLDVPAVGNFSTNLIKVKKERRELLIRTMNPVLRFQWKKTDQ